MPLKAFSLRHWIFLVEYWTFVKKFQSEISFFAGGWTKMIAELPGYSEKKGWPWNEETIIPQTPAAAWPKITIVTPSFNQGKFIEETIRSVLLQNYPNLEYFIIDGGSSDETVEIIKKYERWITYWVSEKDNGQSQAINKGFKKATGGIISWLNSDDMLAKGSLFTVAKAFIDYRQYAFIYGQCAEVTENGFRPYPHMPTDKLPLRYFYEFPWDQSSSFYRRKCLDEIGFIDERFNYTMDLDLFLRIALKYEMYQIEDILSLFRIHDKSKTSTLSHIAEVEQITVFLNLMRAIRFKEGCELFRELGFNALFDKEYKCSTDYPFEHRYEMLFEFLQFYVDRWYIAGDYGKVRSFVDFFRKNHPVLLKNFRLKRKLFMLRFPDWVIKVLRRKR